MLLASKYLEQLVFCYIGNDRGRVEDPQSLSCILDAMNPELPLSWRRLVTAATEFGSFVTGSCSKISWEGQIYSYKLDNIKFIYEVTENKAVKIRTILVGLHCI